MFTFKCSPTQEFHNIKMKIVQLNNKRSQDT